MSKAKEALSKLMDDLDAGKAPQIARKTTLTPREDGSWLRRVTLADGTVVKEEVVAVDQCFALAARTKTGLSQSRFAALLGISVRTLHDWEKGRRAPSGAARTLLTIALRHPPKSCVTSPLLNPTAPKTTKAAPTPLTDIETAFTAP